MWFSKNFKWFMFLAHMSRSQKTLVQLIFDLMSLSGGYFLTVRLAAENTSVDEHSVLFGIFLVLSVLGFRLTRVYRVVVRFAGIRFLKAVILSQILTIMALYGWSLLFEIALSDLFFVLLLLVSIFIVGGSRLAVREVLYMLKPIGQKIIIYGAGSFGAQLLASVRQEPKYEVVGFIDDNKNLHGADLHGLRVFPVKQLETLVSSKNISIIFLAMPNATKEELSKVLDRLVPLAVRVKKIPNITELIDGKGYLDSLEEVRAEDFLGRDRVDPDLTLLSQNVSDRVVLVTGAGGSIGSEICRQVSDCSPKKLLLLDSSEYSLFKIQQELDDKMGRVTESILCSITDELRMKDIVSKYNVDTVYHAAAYKHVPLLEENPFSAILNNVFGTETLLKAAVSGGVSSFTLVSTDKAVRPTNIMGASKRLAEIICQIASSSNEIKTKISIVRFGNVIGSSGSAIPIFRNQIRSGGPVTITHPEITRYFMMIPEAVELVMQASSLAEGGEVFILDMGDPIKITHLVEKMIRLSGNIPGIQGESSEGQIAIKYVGLRPGEKLYEELLIDGDSMATEHPKIQKISENYPLKEVFDDFLSQLKDVCIAGDQASLRKLLSVADIGYNEQREEQTKVQDPLTLNESLQSNNDCVSDSEEGDLEVTQINDSEIKIKVNDSNFLRNSLRGKSIRWLRASFLGILHAFFLISRPLTMGVRCIAVNSSNEILLVKHTYVEGWHLPGGGIIPGESAEEAISRELLEETGYRLLSPPHLIGIYHPNTITKRDHVAVFYSKEIELKKLEVNNLEIKEYRFFASNDLPDDTDLNSKAWIVSGLKKFQSDFDNAT